MHVCVCVRVCAYQVNIHPCTHQCAYLTGTHKHPWWQLTSFGNMIQQCTASHILLKVRAMQSYIHAYVWKNAHTFIHTQWTYHASCVFDYFTLHFLYVSLLHMVEGVWLRCLMHVCNLWTIMYATLAPSVGSCLKQVWSRCGMRRVLRNGAQNNHSQHRTLASVLYACTYIK